MFKSESFRKSSKVYIYVYMINTKFSFERDSNNEKHAFAIINWKETRRYIDNKTKTWDGLNNATWNENPN